MTDPANSIMSLNAVVRSNDQMIALLLCTPFAQRQPCHVLFQPGNSHGHASCWSQRQDSKADIEAIWSR